MTLEAALTLPSFLTSVCRRRKGCPNAGAGVPPAPAFHPKKPLPMRWSGVHPPY